MVPYGRRRMSNKIELEAIFTYSFRVTEFFIISRREEEGAGRRGINDDENIIIVIIILDSAFASSLHKYGHNVIYN